MLDPVDLDTSSAPADPAVERLRKSSGWKEATQLVDKLQAIERFPESSAEQDLHVTLKRAKELARLMGEELDQQSKRREVRGEPELSEDLKESVTRMTQQLNTKSDVIAAQRQQLFADTIKTGEELHADLEAIQEGRRPPPDAQALGVKLRRAGRLAHTVARELSLLRHFRSADLPVHAAMIPSEKISELGSKVWAKTKEVAAQAGERLQPANWRAEAVQEARALTQYLQAIQEGQLRAPADLQAPLMRGLQVARELKPDLLQTQAAPGETTLARDLAGLVREVARDHGVGLSERLSVAAQHAGRWLKAFRMIDSAHELAGHAGPHDEPGDLGKFRLAESLVHEIKRNLTSTLPDGALKAAMNAANDVLGECTSTELRPLPKKKGHEARAKMLAQRLEVIAEEIGASLTDWEKVARSEQTQVAPSQSQQPSMQDLRQQVSNWLPPFQLINSSSTNSFKPEGDSLSSEVPGALRQAHNLAREVMEVSRMDAKAWQTASRAARDLAVATAIPFGIQASMALGLDNKQPKTKGRAIMVGALVELCVNISERISRAQRRGMEPSSSQHVQSGGPSSGSQLPHKRPLSPGQVPATAGHTGLGQEVRRPQQRSDHSPKDSFSRPGDSRDRNSPDSKGKRPEFER